MVSTDTALLRAMEQAIPRKNKKNEVVPVFSGYVRRPPGSIYYGTINNCRPGLQGTKPAILSKKRNTILAREGHVSRPERTNTNNDNIY